MAKSASVIEINGNRYDAVSGHLIGAVRKVAAQVKSPTGGMIDGLSRRPGIINRSVAKTSAGKTASGAGSIGRLKYRAPNMRRQMQRSQTLMRGGVAKPTTLDKVPPSSSKLHKSRATVVSPVRSLYAKTIAKSSKVNRFGQPKVAQKTSRISSRATLANVVGRKPRAVSSAAVARPMPSMVTSASHQQLEKLLDHALVHASSHKQTMRANSSGWRSALRHPGRLRVGLFCLALLVVAGFFAWRDVPQVSTDVASAQANVSASVPDYTPAGYNFVAPASAVANAVTINYKNPANQSTFSISQQDSNWDSSSVAAAIPANSQVQSSEINGTTVYIYGSEDDAKWVNHGVLFSLNNNANLSSDQILKIANSL